MILIAIQDSGGDLVGVGDTASYPVIRVDYSPEAVVTSHPVELGAEVSDHVQTLPLRIAVEIFVTASPLGVAPQLFAVADAVNFLEKALGKLCLIQIDGEGTFSSMALESCTHARTSTQGRSFSLRFKHVRIAASLSVPLPPRLPAPVAAAGGTSEQALGQQATTAGTPTVGPSALFQAGQGVAGFAKAVVGF